MQIFECVKISPRAKTTSQSSFAATIESIHTDSAIVITGESDDEYKTTSDLDKYASKVVHRRRARATFKKSTVSMADPTRSREVSDTYGS